LVGLKLVPPGLNIVPSIDVFEKRLNGLTEPLLVRSRQMAFDSIDEASVELADLRGREAGQTR
jgi:hypothetical protein